MMYNVGKKIDTTVGGAKLYLEKIYTLNVYRGSQIESISDTLL